MLTLSLGRKCNTRLNPEPLPPPVPTYAPLTSVSLRYFTSWGLSNSSFSMMGIRAFLSSPSLCKNWTENQPFVHNIVLTHNTLSTIFFKYSILDTLFSLSWFLSSLAHTQITYLPIHNPPHLLISSLSSLAWSPNRRELASLSLSSSDMWLIFW